MTSPTHPTPVGNRLRQLRTDLGLSVRTLAARAKLSPGFISQVEHGQVSPSITSLERLAAALGVTLGGFFAESASSTAVIVRATDRQELSSAWSRAHLEALAPTGENHLLEPLIMTLFPGGRSGERPHAARGEQFAFVYEGVVTLTLSESACMLQQGDAVSIAAGTLHQWENTDSSPTRLLIVSTRARS